MLFISSPLFSSSRSPLVSIPQVTRSQNSLLQHLLVELQQIASLQGDVTVKLNLRIGQFKVGLDKQQLAMKNVSFVSLLSLLFYSFTLPTNELSD